MSFPSAVHQLFYVNILVELLSFVHTITHTLLNGLLDLVELIVIINIAILAYLLDNSRPRT